MFSCTIFTYISINLRYILLWSWNPKAVSLSISLNLWCTQFWSYILQRYATIVWCSYLNFSNTWNVFLGCQNLEQLALVCLLHNLFKYATATKVSLGSISEIWNVIHVPKISFSGKGKTDGIPPKVCPHLRVMPDEQTLLPYPVLIHMLLVWVVGTEVTSEPGKGRTNERAAARGFIWETSETGSCGRWCEVLNGSSDLGTYFDI